MSNMRALLEPLRLDQLACVAQLLEAIAQLLANLIDRADQAFLRRDVVRAGIHRVARHFARDLAGERIEQRQRLDLVVEQLDANRFALGFRREDVDDIAAHAIGALRAGPARCACTACPPGGAAACADRC